MTDQNPQPADTLEDPEDRKSSKVLLEVINEATDVFRPYWDRCKLIDQFYDRTMRMGVPVGFEDQDYDLYWSTMEVLKAALYARTPVPVAAPMFEDRDPLVATTADMLERALSSSFKKGDIHQVMLGIRDDLAFANRGVMWVRYEDEDGQRICYEDLDRTDFLHEPARKWSEVSWVARRGWMTLDQMEKRFKSVPNYILARADFPTRQEQKDNGSVDCSEKAGVWEIWSRTDNRVYWVVEGVDVVLDERKPHLDLSCFFPAPRPAYGTTKRRSLIPIPDWDRYSAILDQINDLTVRIYELLDEVRLRGFYPANSDKGSAINKLFNDRSSMMQLIAMDGAALAQGSGGIEWLPMDMIVTTIQGLIAARQQLFDDFYQLSGVSDIMRGATEAQETYGAQQLKQSNGSVRVKDKQHELERIAADAAAIAAEIMAAKFSEDALVEMSQMKLRKKSEIKRDIEAVKSQAKQQLEQLMEQAEQTAMQAQQSGQQVDPAQAEQQFQQAQQQILEQSQAQLDELSEEVAIDDVMKLLRDTKARSFVIEIETDSTILQDEMMAKTKANEFYTAFTGGIQGLMGAAAMGDQAIRLASEVLRNTLAPYRPPRRLMSALDDFLDAAPQIAAQQQAQQGGGEDQEAMKELAKAEAEKAKAQMAKVEADSALKQAELQQRMTQMQIDTQEKQAKMQLENGKLELQAAKQQQEFQAKMAEMDAKQNLMQAQTAEILARLNLDVRKQDLEEYRASADIEMRQADMAMNAEQRQVDTAIRVTESERGARMGERQQELAERQAMERE